LEGFFFVVSQFKTNMRSMLAR